MLPGLFDNVVYTPLTNPQMFDAYCRQKGLQFESVRFLFDSERLRPHQTPLELQMEVRAVLATPSFVTQASHRKGAHQCLSYITIVKLLQARGCKHAANPAISVLSITLLVICQVPL